MAEPCTPRAELGGDGAAVARVGEELQRLGVVLAPPAAGCPSVRAVVELDVGGGIAVAVRGSERGSEGRVVSDAALAAAWIDSWLRDDIDVALWSPPPRVALIPPVAPPVVASRDVEPAETAPEVALLDRGAIAFDYEQSWIGGGITWTGITGSVCFKVGRLCLGARVRVADEAQRTVGATAVKRDELAALATASLPIRLGRMTIAPELGLGIGRLETARVDGCKPVAPPPNCDPMTDPTGCMMMPNTPPEPEPGQCSISPDGTMPGMENKSYVGDEFRVLTYGPRVAVALRVAVPLFEHVWLDGIASLMLTPFNHAEPYAPLAPPKTDYVPPEELLLPGEPGMALQLGVGLRIGAP